MTLNRIKTIILFLGGVSKKYKFQIPLLIILGFLSGLLEGVGIGALIPLFSIISGNKIGEDNISRLIAKIFSLFNLNLSLRSLLFLICALFILKAIALFVFYSVRTKIVSDYENNLRGNLYHKTLKSNWPYLSKQKIGHLEYVLIADVGSTTRLLESIITAVLDFSSLLIYVFVAFSISPFITFIALVMGGIILLSFKPFISKTKLYAKKRIALTKFIAHQINENATGLKTIKAAGVEGEAISAGLEFFKNLKDLRIKQAIIKYFTAISIQPLSVLLIGTVFAISYTRQGFNLAAFIALIYLIERIFVYIDKIQFSLHAINDSVPFLKDLMFFQNEVVKNQEEESGQKNFNFTDEIDFKDVGFSYDLKPILQNINFKVKKGQMVGIIGPSGAGKTTIVDLLLRLLKPGKGEILIDGVNISEIDLGKWRRNVGYVSQDIFLKNDTIENNIKFYDKSINDSDMIEAAKVANIYGFIQRLSKGFATAVGERGTSLSGGEKQRIVLARVLARKPKILILDEATSNLDSESEALIKNALEKLKGEMTIIAIAHRFSTIKNADQLIVLDNNSVIEKGDPVKLLENKDSYFYKAYNLS